MKMALKSFPIAFLLCAGGMYSAQANAAPVQRVCDVNGVNACLETGAVAPTGAVLSIQGYAYDLATGDKPIGISGAYITVQNEESFQRYKLPMTALEARPDAIGATIGDGSLKPEDYGIVNAGFVAQVFMASLPPGSYSVQEARIVMKNSGLVKLDLSSADQRASFRVEGADSGFELVKTDGTKIPLTLGKLSNGTIPVTGYPPLRNDNYQINARFAGATGPIVKNISFKYRRPEISIPISLPLVEGFPGIISRLTAANPLNNRPLDLQSLPVVVDQVQNSSTSINGTGINVGSSIQLDTFGGSGSYQFNLSDADSTEGQNLINLWLNTPDAPNVKITATRWDPDKKVVVVKSTEQAPIKVVDVNLQASLIGPSAETCQVLRSIKTENIIGQYSGTDCAIRFDEMPEGIKHNQYISNSVAGALPSVGVNDFKYSVGVIYTDPTTKKTHFYPSRSGVSVLHMTGVAPDPIALSFRSDKLLQPFYDDNQAVFPGKKFGFVDSLQPRALGIVDVASAHRGVRTRVTYPDGSSKEAYSTVFTSAVPLAMRIDEPWEELPVTVESWYEKAPEYKTTENLTFVGIPLGPIVDLEKSFVSHDKAATIIHGSLGLVKGQTRVFDPNTMGTWKVVIRNDKTAEVMSAPVTVQPDGSFAVNLGTLAAGTRYIVAEASMVTASGAVATSSAKSKLRALITSPGQPITASLNVRTTSGRAPFMQTVAVNFTDPKMQPAVREVAWERQSEGGVWEPVFRKGTSTQYSGVNFIAQLDEPGKANFRAVLTNKYSGAVYATDPVELEAFGMPEFKVVAPSIVLAKQPVTFVIEEEPGFEAEYTWHLISSFGAVNIGPTNGKTFTFTPNEVKSYGVEVFGKQKGAPDNPAANVKKTVAVRAVNPLASRATINGPKLLETNKPYQFTAKINDVVSDSKGKGYELKGYWILPDGTRVDGTELTFTPRANDKVLSFYTYVEGYPEDTSVSTYSFSTWTYTWPSDWAIRLQPLYLDVPASVKFSVETNSVRLQDLHGEPLTYTWSLPEGVSQSYGTDSAGTLAINKFGKYQLAVQISDTRGNVTNITSEEFTILPPATVETNVSLLSKYGDKFYSPGAYYLGVKINKLPRGDSFLRNEAWVNDSKVGEFTGSGHYVAFAEPGAYDVTVRTITKSGNYGEQSISQQVQAPPAPVCEIKVSSTTSGSLITPACTVEAGYIKSYTWNYVLGGQAQVATSKSFLVTKKWLSDNAIGTVSLTVESELGAKSTHQVTY